MLKEKLQNFLKKEFPEIDFPLEYSSKKEFGDVFSTGAFLLAKKKKKDPQKIAKDLAKKIEKKSPSFLEKIEPKNGFLNFYFKKEYLVLSLKEVLKKKEKFFKKNLGKRKKTLLEFVSANPTSFLHIGNARGAFFGETLSRLLSFLNFDLKKEYFVNDGTFNTQIIELGKSILGESQAYPFDFLKKIKRKISFQKKDPALLGHKASTLILREIKKFLEKKLKIKFDFYISEENLFKKSDFQKTLNFLKRKKMVYEKDQALWISLKPFGEEDAVLLRRDKTPSYLLSDITYHKDKIKRGFKFLINIWGADHQHHKKRMEKIFKILFPKIKLKILISQLVSLKGEGKLSKRKGKVIWFEDLVNEVGPDACRWFFLSKSLDTPMEFDLNLAKEKSEKNPLFRAEYAWVRILGIEKKAQKKETKLSSSLSLLERELILEIVKTKDLIKKVGENFELNLLVEKIKKLTLLFHQFYEKFPVVEEGKVNSLRFEIILALKFCFALLFEFLGIKPPSKM